jgi:GT2 family glycosyltransferase
VGDFANLSDEQAGLIQDKIEKYRFGFFQRSSGTTLPEINYLGKFDKSSGSQVTEQFFVSMPVKNQEKIIIDILQTLLKNINQNFRLGLLFDNCSDNSLNVCKEFFTNSFNEYSNLSVVYFIQSNGELFESTSENVLFLLCRQKYFVSIQSDIYFTDKTFLERSTKAFTLLPRLFAISGKAIISFEVLTNLKIKANKLWHSYNFFINFRFSSPYKKKLGFYSPFFGYFGDLAQPPKSYMQFNKKQLNTLYVGEAVIRGPVIWVAEVFRKFYGFDDVAFTLGRDDCDLCFRALLQGYISGYLPCSAFSIYEQGTTRKKRSQTDQTELDNRISISKNNPGILMQFWKGELSQNLVKDLQRIKRTTKKIYGRSIFLVDES